MTRAEDKALAFRIYELIQGGAGVAEGDYIEVVLPPTPGMRLRGESCQPTSERVESRHIELAKRMCDTPIKSWVSAGLA